MPPIRLSLAAGHYDHLRDLMDGTVRAEGIDLTSLVLPIEEILFRFIRFREWDISEMSLGKLSSLISQDDRLLTALPVFPSRFFRQSSIYVASDSPLRDARALEGKRIGIPEWSQTAGIYVRGWLAHQVGLDLEDIRWFQASVFQSGRKEPVTLDLPPGLRVEVVADRSLTQLLLEGRVDAIITARPPYAEGARPPIRRLIENYQQVEQNYFEATGIFPIMHLIAVKQEVLDRHPWVATNLFKAFQQAKENSLQRARTFVASRFPIPWNHAHAAEAERLFGTDIWPYGLEPSRKTLEAFLQFAHEQGVCHRRLRPEELFPEQVLSLVRV